MRFSFGLLLAGLAMIGTGLALVLFTDAAPAVLFILGIISCFIGIVNGITVRPEGGRPVSADPNGDAYALNNIATYGSASGDIGGDAH